MEPHHLALPVGFQIEHFRIEAVLGKGGFGITYLAVDLQLDKRVAIKELLPDTIATRIEGVTVVPHSAGMQENWEWARERFLEEARTLATFSHPAIVGVHRLIEANGTVYMVMDYVEGESYEARLQRIGTETDQASLMAVVSPILSGLEEVHAHGLLHRDIKPENILIDKRGQPVLIDFGSARESVGKTMTMTSIVTHGYSPIEQYQTKGRMGPWTDIYAMSAVVYRAMTGHKPPIAVERIEKDECKPLAHFHKPSHFSTELEAAIDHGLRVKVSERPQTVGGWGVPPYTQASRAIQPPSKAQDRSSYAQFSRPMGAAIGLISLALVFAGGVTVGARYGAQRTMEESKEAFRRDKLQIEAQAAQAVAATKKAEANALDRIRALEDLVTTLQSTLSSLDSSQQQASTEISEFENAPEQLQDVNRALAAKLTLVTAKLATVEKSLADSKADNERRQEAQRKAEQEKAQAIRNNVNSITASEAFAMNQSALAAAGRQRIQLSTSLTPEAIRLGQKSQLIVLITGPDIFNASASAPADLPGLSVADADKYNYKSTAEMPRGVGANRLWSKTFAYQITAHQPGRFLVPSFSLQVDDITLQTYPVEVRVSP